MVIFDNEPFRKSTWYRDPEENLTKHWSYAAGAFIPTSDRTPIEWMPGVPELRVCRSVPAELEVECRSTAPSFDSYVIRINGGEPHLCMDGCVLWKLVPGDNSRQVQRRSLFGIDGPPAIAKVTFQP